MAAVEGALVMALIIGGGGSGGGSGGEIIALQNQIAQLTAQHAADVAALQSTTSGIQSQLLTVQTAVASATTTEATVNKGMPALPTAADGVLATATPIQFTPSQDGYVSVFVNGIQVQLGNGTRSADCYFSNSDGADARLYADIAQGDGLYWNGSIAGYELTADDLITLMYERTV